MHRAVVIDCDLLRRHVESEELPQSVLTLWAASKMCNMLFIYRLVRFLPASKNIRIIVGTVFDEVRNGGAFFGVLLVRHTALIRRISFERKTSELLLHLLDSRHGTIRWCD